MQFSLYSLQRMSPTTKLISSDHFSIFFAFLQRPLQAWSFINATAAKCRLLLAYHNPDANPAEQECLRRVFWSCYILERYDLPYC
jgi:hypothetical protein